MSILGLACIDMSAPKGPFAISVLLLPSPSVVVGDIMRDSNGVPAPVNLVAYDAHGAVIAGASSQIFITDSAPVAHLDANRILIGDKLGLVHLVGQIGSLQTTVVNVPITMAPAQFRNVSSLDTTVSFPFVAGDSAQSTHGTQFSVSLTGAGDSASQGFIVRYVLAHAPATAATAKSPAVYLANGSGKVSTVETTDATGAATHYLYVNSLALADSALVAGTKTDSAVIEASTSYKGMTVDVTAAIRHSYHGTLRPVSVVASGEVSPVAGAQYTGPFDNSHEDVSMITTGGPRNSAPGTLNQLFFDAVTTYNRPDAFQVKRNGRYEPISHDTIVERVRRTALGLEELGVRSGDRVGILSENRPEWAIADFACLMLGVADVPIYPNLPSDQVAYILRDSGAVAIFVSNAEQAAKIALIRGECPALRHVVTFADASSGSMTLVGAGDLRGGRRRRAPAWAVPGARTQRATG